jgi:hypothetical protein
MIDYYSYGDQLRVLGVAYTVDNFLSKHEYVGEGE